MVVVMITGSRSGLGRETALALAQAFGELRRRGESAANAAQALAAAPSDERRRVVFGEGAERRSKIAGALSGDTTSSSFVEAAERRRLAGRS